MTDTTRGNKNSYRTVFVSDIHLGSRGCKAELLLDFLRHTECEKLYLIGDIIDGWALRRSWFFPQLHNDVVQKILRKARNGTEVIYIPGNHDEFARDYEGLQFGGIPVLPQTIHVTADGKRLLVIHGDQFDGFIRLAPWLSHLGDRAYSLALVLNDLYNYVRRWTGKPYWSFSAYLKRKVKKAIQYIGEYEKTLADAARRAGADGVVCGHIHHAEIRQFGDVLYLNDGDWVESCSALVEHFDGRLELVHWHSLMKRDLPAAAA